MKLGNHIPASVSMPLRGGDVVTTLRSSDEILVETNRRTTYWLVREAPAFQNSCGSLISKGSLEHVCRYMYVCLCICMCVHMYVLYMYVYVCVCCF